MPLGKGYGLDHDFWPAGGGQESCPVAGPWAEGPQGAGGTIIAFPGPSAEREAA